MLIPLLIGGIQTANSEVIVPANTVITWNNSILNNFIQMPEYPNYTFTEDFDCSSYTTYSSGSTETAAIWGCIGALSDSVGSSSGSSSSTTTTDSAATNNINSLGEGVAASTALTTALTALPQTSKESKLSCGVGTGAYSSKYAIGFGCASKLNERVDVNAGGSYVFGGSKSYGGGTLDSGVLKAGFVFKLGELNKSTQLSLNESKELKKEVNDLKAKNDEIISHNQKLLARLEKLENMALKFQSNSDVISMSK